MQHHDSIACDTKLAGVFGCNETGRTAKSESPDKGLSGIQATSDGGSIATYDPNQRVDRLLSTETSMTAGFTKTEKRFQEGNPDGLKSEISIKDTKGREQITAYLQNGERVEVDMQDGKLISTRKYDAQGNEIAGKSSKTLIADTLPPVADVNGDRSNVALHRQDRGRSNASPDMPHEQKTIHRPAHGGTDGADHHHESGSRRHSRHGKNNHNTPDRGDHHQTSHPLKGNNNAERIYNFLREKGLSAAQAAGVLGNLKQENAAFDPNKPGDGGHSLGIAQWNDGKDSKRKTALFNFARREHADPRDLNTQLNFLWHELQTTESKALKALLKTHRPEEAALVFSRLYERAGDPNNRARAKNARVVFNEFGSDGSLLASR